MSIWASIYAQKSTMVTDHWLSWVNALSRHARRDDKGGPLYTVGIVPAGMARKQLHVEGADFACLDIDEGSNSEIAAALQSLAPYAYHLSSSFNHGKNGQTKIRVLLPLARRVTREEQTRIWPPLSRLVNNIVDQKTKDPGRAYFLPSAPPGAQVLVYHNQQDRWLDPDHLLALALAAPSLVSQPITIESSELQVQLDSIANKLRRIGKGHPLHEAALALVHGKPFAAVGERHATILHLTGWLAFRTEQAPLPPQAIEALFRDSLEAMAANSPPGKPCDTTNAAVKAYETALTHVNEVKERERIRVQNKHATIRSPKWTSESIERCAQVQGCVPDELAYVVQRDRAHYVLKPNAYFSGPFVEKDAVVVVAQSLVNSPIRLYEPNASGGFKQKSFSDIVIEYGEIAERTIANLATQRTYYNRPQKTINEAVCPLQTHQPQYNSQIDQWLRLFAGSEQTYNKLLDWMACAPDLNKLLCALTLAGAPGTGKTLFAQGVASLWAEGGAASGPETILGNFNEDLARCPLVFGDETLPRAYRYESVTTKLRQEIATLVRTLTRKYFPPVSLHGALRFILATNNPMILASNISTKADLEAVAVRFFYIETDPEAERFLLGLPHEVKDQWRVDGIASHALWLQDNRQVEPAGRFWVTGDIERMHRLLVTSSDWNSWLCEWIVKGLLDAFKKSDQNEATVGRVQISDGHVYVATSAITEGWQTYTNYPHIAPDPRKIATALRSIAITPKAIQRRPNNYRFFDIDVGHLVAWADEKGICGEADIEFAIAQGITERPKVVNLDDRRKDKQT